MHTEASCLDVPNLAVEITSRNECVMSAGWVASDQSSCCVVNARGSWHWRQVCHVMSCHHSQTCSCSVTDINVSLLVHCLVSMMSWAPASVRTNDVSSVAHWVRRHSEYSILPRSVDQWPFAASTAAKQYVLQHHGGRIRKCVYANLDKRVNIKISVAAWKRTPVSCPVILILLMKQRRQNNT